MQPWVEPGEILLHIGPHKTGTTALQAAFAAARPQLPELDVRYPGDRGSHWHAAAAAMARTTGSGRVPRSGYWAQVLAEIPGPATADRARTFLSSEMYCETDDEAAARIVADLGRPVRVVLTLRALEKLLPSTWQQAVKTARMPAYERWLHRVLDEPGRATVWRRYDTIRLIERWGRVVGPDRVCAVVLDDRDPGGMLRHFESLLGLPDGLLVPPPVSNRSMTAAEAEAVRRIYAELGGTLAEPLRQRWLRRGGIVAMVERSRPAESEPRIATPAWAVERARELQADLTGRLPATGVLVVGDPGVLVGTTQAPDLVVATPEHVPVTPVAHLMVGALHAAERDLDRTEARLERARERVVALRARKPKVKVKRVPADLTQTSGKAMLRELARRARSRPFRRNG